MCISYSFKKLQVWKWNGCRKTSWVKVDEVHMELPRDTLIEVEFVQELRGEVGTGFFLMLFMTGISK